MQTVSLYRIKTRVETELCEATAAVKCQCDNVCSLLKITAVATPHIIHNRPRRQLQDELAYFRPRSVTRETEICRDCIVDMVNVSILEKLTRGQHG